MYLIHNAVIFKLPCTLRRSVFLLGSRGCSSFFSPREKRKRRGRREGFSAILPVIHANRNDLRYAISIQEKPCVVRTVLCQIIQGVADGSCGFTGNIRPWDRLRKYRDQIRQNFSSYKLENRQLHY